MKNKKYPHKKITKICELFGICTDLSTYSHKFVSIKVNICYQKIIFLFFMDNCNFINIKYTTYPQPLFFLFYYFSKFYKENSSLYPYSHHLLNLLFFILKKERY